MPPPPAEQLASRIFLGPALRAQPDRRLVKLVREGYEAAFEEIVRRYRRPLDRFAAAIVGSRSEDVTQDAFSKALLALRGSETDIELRPWLYRIVRNTALNDLRDRGPATEELAEAIPGARSAAEDAERREEIAELMGRLRALPEPQRAAIVMRELEGLSHEEIATALGVSGGAARQAIYRARAALREGLGALVPLPLLRTLVDHGADAAAGAGGLAAGAAGAASAGGAGAALGGLGAGGALKVGAATVLIAGTLGAGVAIHDGRGGRTAPEAAAAAQVAGGDAGGSGSSRSSSGESPAEDDGGRGTGAGASGHGGRGPGDDARGDGGGSSGHGGGSGEGGSGGHGPSGQNGPGPGHGGSSGHGSGSSHGDDDSGHDGGDLDHHSGGDGGGEHSGSHDSGDDDGSGSGGGEDFRSGSGSSGGSSDDELESSEPAPTPPPVETTEEDHSGEDLSGGDSGESSSLDG